MRLILLGPPGAGKGTLASSLKDTLKILHISTGDILREEMKKQSPIGMKIKGLVDAGQLVPDEVVTDIIKQRVESPELKNQGLLFDGFPRTVKQAQDLDKILEEIEQPIDYALYMSASTDLIIRRLTGRLVCRKCGAVFHKFNRPPKKAGACDECGGELYQRADDNEETIRKRLDVYMASTEPIIKYYEKQKKLIKLDGDKDTDILEKDLMKILNGADKHHKH